MSSDTINTIRDWLAGDTVRSIAQALVIVLLAWLLSRWASRRLVRLAHQNQSRILLSRAISGGILGIAFAWALSVAGVDVSVLLGTAGFLTIAIGFAAQTSISNLISGLFLMAEKPFSLGDVIRVGGETGEVTSIDLISIKLRTFDNLLVRIPNEAMLKANITNVSHYDIRRYDLLLGVSYSDDLAKVRKVLLGVAEENPLCLKHPQAVVIFQSFADSSMNLQFSVWATRETFLPMKNSIAEEVKSALDLNGITIPFPQRSIHLPNAAVSGALLGADEQG